MLQFLAQGMILDQIGRKAEWAEWRAKELEAQSEVLLKKVNERITERRIELMEEVTKCRAQILGLIEKHQRELDSEGEGWKKGQGT